MLPHPHEDLPFFLFFARLTMMAATTATNTKPTMAVPILLSDRDRQFFCLAVLLDEEHVDHAGEGGDLEDKSDDVQVTRERAANLVDEEGDYIREAALIADCEPCPLRVVHLALDCADCRETRSAEQVEHEE